MKNHWTALLLLILLLAGCGEPSPSPSEPVPTDAPPPTAAATAVPSTTAPTDPPAVDTVPRFEPTTCPFLPPAGQIQGQTLECGDLVVWEDRDDPDSRTLHLAVAIFHPAGGATHPDPIVYLSGGPGGSILEFIDLNFGQAFEPILAGGRDLILLDQRGVGLSEPALDCPNVRELSLELLDNEQEGRLLEADEIDALLLDSLLECEQELSEVADLSDYHSVSNAADVNDLRLALGYEQVNLWGTSYGTRLALGVMRDYPQSIRAVVLDSVYPPDVDLYLELPANADRAFDLLFASCAADPDCSAAFPDLRQVFFDTVEQLNAEPASIQVSNLLNGKSYPAILDGDTLVSLLFDFMYYHDVLPSLPQILYDASEGDYSMLRLIYGSLIAQGEAVSQGMQLSVQCNEELPFSSPEAFAQALDEYPELRGMFEHSTVGPLGYVVCAAWDSGQAAALEDQAIHSDVPTLLIAGAYDPITPPEWGQHAAETLPNGHFFEYPGLGHGVSVVAGCPQQMLLEFLNDPDSRPDDRCIDEMDFQFLTGAPTAAVEMEPYIDQAQGLRGLAPTGWEELLPGVLARNNSSLDLAALILSRAPFSPATLINQLSEQLALDSVPQADAQRQANELEWSLYYVETSGVAVDIALAAYGDGSLAVMLQSAPNERDALYEAVFLPAVDALVPSE
ncbi:MAG: alpha/beta fold hydrolase [Chloroflexia bacterium]|nr:alpha/beta fold hydrolase [Chloroflexia bacterium]